MINNPKERGAFSRGNYVSRDEVENRFVLLSDLCGLVIHFCRKVAVPCAIGTGDRRKLGL